jgi:hypothetical protein
MDSSQSFPQKSAHPWLTAFSAVILAGCLAAATIALSIFAINLNPGLGGVWVSMKDLASILVYGVQANVVAFRGLLIRSVAALGGGGILILLLTRRERLPGQG